MYNMLKIKFSTTYRILYYNILLISIRNTGEFTCSIHTSVCSQFYHKSTYFSQIHTVYFITWISIVRLMKRKQRSTLNKILFKHKETYISVFMYVLKHFFQQTTWSLSRFKVYCTYISNLFSSLEVKRKWQWLMIWHIMLQSILVQTRSGRRLLMHMYWCEQSIKKMGRHYFMKTSDLLLLLIWLTIKRKIQPTITSKKHYTVNRHP